MTPKFSLISSLRTITSNPYINLSAGAILIWSSVSEVIASTEEAAMGAHHGVLVFGILHTLRTIPEIVHAIEMLLKAKEEQDNKA